MLMAPIRPWLRPPVFRLGITFNRNRDLLELLAIRRETLEARRDDIEALEELNGARAPWKRVMGSIE